MPKGSVADIRNDMNSREEDRDRILGLLRQEREIRDRAEKQILEWIDENSSLRYNNLELRQALERYCLENSCDCDRYCEPIKCYSCQFRLLLEDQAKRGI
jgi:hypothetical protein